MYVKNKPKRNSFSGDNVYKTGLAHCFYKNRICVTSKCLMLNNTVASVSHVL